MRTDCEWRLLASGFMWFYAERGGYCCRRKFALAGFTRSHSAAFPSHRMAVLSQIFSFILIFYHSVSRLIRVRVFDGGGRAKGGDGSGGEDNAAGGRAGLETRREFAAPIMPAEAGTRRDLFRFRFWVPAYAGMTRQGRRRKDCDVGARFSCFPAACVRALCNPR